VSRERQVFNTRNGVTGGVWRDGDVVIKTLRASAPDAHPRWIPSHDPRHWLYWRREAFAYETDLPARLGLPGPSLLSSETTDDGVELQLAAYDGRTAGSLTVDDLARVARCMGESQGRDDLPAEPWLSERFLRTYSSTRVADHSLLGDDAAWEQDLVAPFATDELRQDLAFIHANRERLYAIMEALPRTVCHLDLFPANIFANDDSLGLIDWSFTGDGAVGEDIGNLIPDSIFDRDLHISLLPELEDRLIPAYIAGLYSAGWSGDDRLAILGVHASAVKYDWLGARVLAGAGDAEHAQYGGAPTNATELFAARWTGLALMGRWARLAIAEAGRLRV
jgi:hypothetical protein